MSVVRTLAVAALGMFLLSVTLASAQEYPNRPIRITVPGSGNFFDIAARIFAHELTEPLGQPVIVDNRATGIIAAELVAKAPPDGYTLLISTGTLWLAPFMQQVTFDALRDFAPITLTTRSPTVLVVHPTLPVKSVKDLIALARSRPGMLNYATGSIGSTGHMAVELFRDMADLKMVRVGYKGSGPALIDLMAGQVQLMFSTTGSVSPHVKSGKLKALAVSTAEPSPLVPGLPTVAASGLPGFSIVSNAGLFVPAKTPAAIVARLNQELVRILHRADMREKFFGMGVESAGTTSEEFAAFIKADIVKMGKVIKDAGIRAE
jgi:tripartite-type tricarboxylate transporter receptor subunit TctC